MPGRGARAQDVVAEIDGVDLVHALGGHGQHAAAEAAVAGVADHQVQPSAQVLVRLVHDLLRDLGLLQARLVDEALAAQLFDLLLRLHGAVLAGIVGDGDVVAVLGENDGDALSDVVASAGDQCRLVHVKIDLLPCADLYLWHKFSIAYFAPKSICDFNAAKAVEIRRVFAIMGP